MGIGPPTRRFDARKRQYALSPYHDHIIRDMDDLRNHLAYIARQCSHHGCGGSVRVDGMGGGIVMRNFAPEGAIGQSRLPGHVYW